MDLHTGDALTVLRTLPDQSAQCCVTSPPYFGLRDYGTATWDGGDPACDHAAPCDAPNGNKGQPTTHPGRYAGDCRKCGARRIDQQIGVERTPDEYVANLTTTLRELRRVLRDDGVLWLVLGDSYAGSWGNYSGQNRGRGKQRTITSGSLPTPAWNGRESERPNSSMPLPGLKPKDLIGIPWMVAFALRADGWYLRSEVIWHKTNGMPSSVKDRPTYSHEQIFLLSKSRKYAYYPDAVRQPPAKATIERDRYSRIIPNEDAPYAVRHDHETLTNPTGVNLRSVWSMATGRCKEAHFAVFPEELVRRCVLASTVAGDVVIDPFVGSGTTGVVCKKLGRDFIGIDLNPEYVSMAQRRIAAVPDNTPSCRVGQETPTEYRPEHAL